MIADPQPLLITDPATGNRWRLPARPVSRVDAEVAERWFLNVALAPERFREFVPLEFLAPDLRGGRAVLSLCRIRMRHGAPDWVPLELGPACDNCALRVGCIDLRDGSPAVWVDRRTTTHVLGRALRLLGFPAVDPELRMVRADDQALVMDAGGGIHAEVRAGQAPHAGRDPRGGLFADAAELTAWVQRGIRSYTAAAEDGRYLVVDLEKEGARDFSACAGWGGWLRTPRGAWPVDGVYRTSGGRYRWRVLGRIDGHGRPLS
jgi:hypothetical protein